MWLIFSNILVWMTLVHWSNGINVHIYWITVHNLILSTCQQILSNHPIHVGMENIHYIIIIIIMNDITVELPVFLEYFSFTKYPPVLSIFSSSIFSSYISGTTRCRHLDTLPVTNYLTECTGWIFTMILALERLTCPWQGKASPPLWINCAQLQIT